MRDAESFRNGFLIRGTCQRAIQGRNGAQTELFGYRPRWGQIRGVVRVTVESEIVVAHSAFDSCALLIIRLGASVDAIGLPLELFFLVPDFVMERPK